MAAGRPGKVNNVDGWVDPLDNSRIPAEEYPWLTLITCRGYDEERDDYLWRVVVRAVQVKVE